MRHQDVQDSWEIDFGFKPKTRRRGGFLVLLKGIYDKAMEKNRKIVLVLLGTALLAGVSIWAGVWRVSGDRGLKVVFFDVGQGDAIFAETPQKTQILIDGGPGSQILEKLNEEMPFYDRQIDLVILTHPDLDHLTGLVEVLKSYDVKEVLWTGVEGDSAEWREFKALADKTRKNILKRGQSISVGQNLGFQALAPLEDFVGKEVKDYNTSSLVLKMTFGQSDFLLTGDSPVSVETQLVEQGVDLKSEVLKVSHHGSKTATSERFLEAVQPDFAVIQVGESNKYGHPASETLGRLEKYGIKVMRTDEMGDIKFFTNGSGIELAR